MPEAYPDKHDHITTAMVRSSRQYEAYWERSEKGVLRALERHARSRLSTPTRCLDAGCGDGRLLPLFSRLFGHVVAIEPDPDRCDAARRCVAGNHLPNVEIRQIPIQELSSTEQYEAIVCSHVIQHVNCADADAIMANLRDVLAPCGALYLMTCHAASASDRFVRSYLRGGGSVEEEVLAHDFDALFGTDGVLPIHFFSAKSLSALAHQAGLEVQCTQVYHLDRLSYPLWRLPVADAIANSCSLLQKRLGRDVFVIMSHADSR